jgi:hypothetical protein
MRKVRLTPSFAVAVLALMVATAGTAMATGYLITSTKQIKPSVRKALKGKRGARGFDGVRGAQGVQGVAGAPGAPGLLSLTTVDGAPRTYAPGEYGAPPTAQCPSGSTVVGTGFNGPFDVVGGFVKKYGTFVGGFFENGSSIPIDGNVQAICAQLPAGASATRSASSWRSQYLADVARAERWVGR